MVSNGTLEWSGGGVQPPKSSVMLVGRHWGQPQSSNSATLNSAPGVLTLLMGASCPMQGACIAKLLLPKVHLHGQDAGRSFPQA